MLFAGLVASAFATGAGLPPPISTPQYATSDKGAWVAPLATAGEVVWFTEESRLVEAAIAAELRRRGYAVEPVEHVNAAIDRMASGTFPDRPGGCEALPPARAWLEMNYASLHKVISRLECRSEPVDFGQRPNSQFEPGCTLSVKVYPPGESHRPAERLSLRAKLGVSPVALGKAVAQLDLEPPPTTISGLLLAGRGSGWKWRPVVTTDLVGTGRWADGEVASTRDRLSSLYTELFACEQERAMWLGSATNGLSLAVHANGSVERCEPWTRSELAPHAECRCEVMKEKLRFDRGHAGRRLRFSAYTSPSEKPTAKPGPQFDQMIDFSRTAATDATAMLGSTFLVGDAYRMCLDRSVPYQRWPLTLAVDRNGRVAKADVGVPLDGADTTLQSCIANASEGAQLVCPFSGGATVNAQLVLGSVPKENPAKEAELAWLTTLKIELPEGYLQHASPQPDAPLFALSANGDLIGYREAPGPIMGHEVRLFADARATGAQLRQALTTLNGPHLDRVFLYTEGGKIAGRLLLVFPPNDAGFVSVGPEPETGWEWPDWPPGQAVAVRLPSAATVGQLTGIVARLDQQDLILLGI